VLDRRIGEGGRYPAVDVLRSLSRTVPGVNLPAENALTTKARAILAMWQDMADLVRLGAYKSGGDPAVDEAIRLAPRIEAFLSQAKDQPSSVEQGFADLEAALCG
jgi:flagellum-specific ATP synthase